MIRLALPLAFAAAVISSTMAMAADCPYESRLESWQQAEEIALKLGIEWPIDHIQVCRNGAAVFLRERIGSPRIAVRFVRVNQDSFQSVLGPQFVSRRGYRLGATPNSRV